MRAMGMHDKKTGMGMQKTHAMGTHKSGSMKMK
jgi:hypothetical protein